MDTHLEEMRTRINMLEKVLESYITLHKDKDEANVFIFLDSELTNISLSLYQYESKKQKEGSK